MQEHILLELQDILKSLNLSNVDEVLQLESLQDKITTRSGLHPIVSQKYLERLHEIIIYTQLLEKKSITKPLAQQEVIEISKMHCYGGVRGCDVEQGQILEVLGRPNSGKTKLMIQCAKQAIQKGMQPILLSSSGFCTMQYRQFLQCSQLVIFQFTNICQLAMLIHALGNQILHSQKNIKHLLLIDTLSHIESQNQPLQFDSSQKFRRLLSTFSLRTQTCVIFSFRINTSLFPTQYKKQFHRPKCKNSKQWDGWANKTIYIDLMERKCDGKYIIRVCSVKSIDCQVIEVIV